MHHSSLDNSTDAAAEPVTTHDDVILTEPSEFNGPVAESLFARCAKPDIAASCSFSSTYADVGWPKSEWQLPLVYHDRYNIRCYGIERLHPFDSNKFSKVVQALVQAGLLQQQQLVAPLEASLELLLDVHSQEYLDAVHCSSFKIAQVTEIAALVILPVMLLRHHVISPLKYHAAGTVLAAGLAIKHGWAINIGGGMHHSSASQGMGWCAFDDVMLAIRRLRAASNGAVRRVLYIDLDAHQGNGVERDKLLAGDEDLFVVDMYNARVFPKDDDAKAAINVAVELKSGADEDEYLPKLRIALDKAVAGFPDPHLIFYNAGSNILANDPLGRLAVSEAGVLQRDEMVWQLAADKGCPIVMTLSGGYAPHSAACVSKSLISLFNKFNLQHTVPAPPPVQKTGWW